MLRAIFMISISALVPAMAAAHSSFTGYSGAPGSNGTCTSSCHAQSSFAPTVAISGFPDIYEPGHQYTISVWHMEGSAINQFNASVRFGESEEYAGSLTPGLGTDNYDTPNETNGIRWQYANNDSGTFVWTAPDAGGGIAKLYWAGLQGTRANGADTQIVMTATEVPSRVEYLPGQPNRFTMKQNYPNPFNGQTIIEIDLAEAGRVDFVITNILGQLVYEWRETVRQPGTVSIRWDGRRGNGAELPSGVYFYRLASSAGTITRKMMLLR